VTADEVGQFLDEPVLAWSDATAEALSAAGTPVHRFIHGLVKRLPPAARRLVRGLADLPWVSAELAAALGPDGGRSLRLLVSTGLVLPLDGAPERFRPVPLVAAAVRHRQRFASRRAAVTAAARWYLSTGATAEAIAAIEALPAAHRDAGLTLLYAEALNLTGDIDAALDAYASIAGDSGPLPAAVAWRYGMARYMHSGPVAGLAVLRRGLPAQVPQPDADVALLLAWTAAASWAGGDAGACAAFARQAFDAATATGNGGALAAAHVALALHAQLSGDRPGVQAHYDRALAFAESARDRFAVVRIRVNRASSLLHEARYRPALEMVRPAVALAESAGFESMLALALCNEGEALGRLGQLDEAVRRYDRAASIYQRLHSEKVAYPLVGLGDLYRQRLRTSQARAAYEEALRVATGAGDRQALVRSLAGLARAAADDDPEQAQAVAAQALAQASGPLVTAARLAAGWAAAATAGRDAVGVMPGRDAARDGARADSRAHAREAAGTARRHRDRAALADALELSAATDPNPVSAHRALTEALAIWEEAEADVDADRVRVRRAEVGRCRADRVAGALATERLTAAGVVPVAATGTPSVHIHTLGRFAVSVDGRPVPPTAWQSRKARELLRILVTRRGRALTREELVELLWPAEPADRVGHRLSVALSTVRAVFDPDRGVAADRYVLSEANSVALNMGALTVDAETFLEYAQFGLAAVHSGQSRDGYALLDAANRAYTGDFLEDEPYDDLAAGVREELRATFRQVARALADLSRQAGRTDDAVRYLLRLLTVDPYDEPSHRDLIALLTGQGRHGEARRAHARYVQAMRDIDVVVSAGTP
jgi:DNA-binding SARP family transcriptional activator